MKPSKRLGSPILADGPPDPLNQFLTISLHPLCIMFCLLVVSHIHHKIAPCGDPWL
ncbi:hypothetical protein KSD_93330 [Ktedonobacter sp. SOSP1-85]|nr:hypothetical protein KSD_93330 [Ktedonobacter sp. SOSP1-85]